MVLAVRTELMDKDIDSEGKFDRVDGITRQEGVGVIS